MSPHHVGQRDVSLTTPEANISLNSNQRINQKVTRSWSRTPRDPLINVRGAMRIQRKPVSRRRLSLREKSNQTTGNDMFRGAWGKKEQQSTSKHSPLEVEEDLSHLK